MVCLSFCLGAGHGVGCLSGPNWVNPNPVTACDICFAISFIGDI